MDRKWLPNFAELVDRLSIHQLKEVFISEHKDKYACEMKDIVHDLDLLINDSKIELTGELVHLLICLAQINEHIWYNESKARSGLDQDPNLLRLTHGLNGIRSRIMNRILDVIGKAERKDYKVDSIAAEFDQWKMSIITSK